MRIIFFVGHAKSMYKFFLDTMKTFIGKGHEVFACGEETERKWRDIFGRDKIIYKQFFIRRNGLNPLVDLKTLYSIRKILQNLKPDKIFAFQAKTVVYTGIAAQLLGIKEFYPLFAGAGSLFLKDDIKTKIIRTIFVMEYKLAVRNCAAIFFQNRDDENLLRGYGVLNSQRVVMLHGSGVNISEYYLQDLPKECAFIFVGRLIKDKGVMEYLEASVEIKKRYPYVRCLLLGPFDSNPSALSEDELQSYLNRGIEYLGEQEDVRPFLRQSSVFVLPSYREGTSRAALEAMSCGRAVITTDAPGCRETVVDGVNGLLVPIKNIEALVNAMERLIKSPQRVKYMGLQGRKIVEDIFASDKVDKVICDAMGLN